MIASRSGKPTVNSGARFNPKFAAMPQWFFGAICGSELSPMAMSILDCFGRPRSRAAGRFFRPAFLARLKRRKFQTPAKIDRSRK
jgi:hypothetical protein